MPQEKAIVDKLLTNASQAIVNEGMIARSILTPISVVQTTGKIGKYGNAHLRLLTNIAHAGKGQYPMIDVITRESDSYDVEMHGLQDILTRKDYLNVEQPFDAELDLVMGLLSVMEIAEEKSLADTLSDTSIITQNKTLSGNAQYDNLTHDDSNPLEDSREAHGTIRDKIGRKANIAIMDGKTRDNLSFHSAILDKLGFKDNRAGSLSNEELARALDVEELLVGEGVYNAAKEGQADDIQPIWGSNLIYAHRAKKAAKYQKTLGYRVTLTGDEQRVVQKQDLFSPRGAKAISVDDSYDNLLADVTCAFLIKDTQ